MRRGSNILVGLDIGTTKVCAVVVEVRDGGEIQVVGIGTSESKGLRKGVVVNIEHTVEAIRKAVEEAQLMAGVQIRSVLTGIAGSHIQGMNSRGVIAIQKQEVSRGDIERVIEAAKAVAIPMNREILHVLPLEFTVDDQEGIRDPLGMSGVRLEVLVHIITAAVTSIQNILKSVHRAGLEVTQIILQPLASSEAVLTPEERELGVAVLDIGGGTTDLAIFAQGGIRHTAVLGIGGNHVTNDIAVGLRTPIPEAELIKIRYGSASRDRVQEEETLDVASVGGRPPRKVSRQLLTDIIEPRVEEIFSLIRREILRAGYGDLIPAGVVLTGGTSLLEGITDVAERILGMPARVGTPQGVSGLVDIVHSPIYATGVGLTLYGIRHGGMMPLYGMTNGNWWDRMKSRLRRWFQDVF